MTAENIRAKRRTVRFLSFFLSLGFLGATSLNYYDYQVILFKTFFA